MSISLQFWAHQIQKPSNHTCWNSSTTARNSSCPKANKSSVWSPTNPKPSISKTSSSLTTALSRYGWQEWICRWRRRSIGSWKNLSSDTVTKKESSGSWRTSEWSQSPAPKSGGRGVSKTSLTRCEEATNTPWSNNPQNKQKISMTSSTSSGQNSTQRIGRRWILWSSLMCMPETSSIDSSKIPS